MSPDPRRLVPRTDTLLADPQLAAAGKRLGRGLVKGAVQRVQQRIRDGEVAPPDAVGAVLASLPGTASSLRPVLNATGVLVHTNLGRAPLSSAAVEAIVAAAGTTDVELDLDTGRPGPGRHRARSGTRAGPRPGRARRDRRRLPHPRPARQHRCPVARGRDDEP